MAQEQKSVRLLNAIETHKSLAEIAKGVGMSLDEAQEIIRKLKSVAEFKSEQVVLIVDGSSKGNPGPAGAGIVLRDAGGAEIDSISIPLGIKTNNEAEYLALIAGFKRAKEMGISKLKVLSDSELLVKQMKGEYQIKSKRILPLIFEAAKLKREFASVTFELAKRAQTRCADKLARAAAKMSGADEVGDEKR